MSSRKTRYKIDSRFGRSYRTRLLEKMSIQQQQQFWDETKDFWVLLSNNINFKANGVKSLEEIKAIIMNNHINNEIIMEECGAGDETETGWGFCSLWEIFMSETFEANAVWTYWEFMKIRCRGINNKETKLIKSVENEVSDINDSDMEYIMDLFVKNNKLNMLFN